MTGLHLHLWDDPRARRFEPYALTRPVSELRAGAEIVRARWERALGGQAAGFAAGAHLADFEEDGVPGWVREIPAGAVIASSRCVVALDAGDAGDARQRRGAADGAARWRCAGRLAAVRVTRAVGRDALDGAATLEELAATHADTDAGGEVELSGRWLDEVWDLVGQLDEQLAEDALALGAAIDGVEPAVGVTVLGTHPVHIETGAAVEPLTLLDATAGPILVRRGARIAAFSRVDGPSVIGKDALVLGGRLAVVSIGDRCKVHGELSHTVFLGYCNKAHDGFVGHSYVGRWANLGAGTITSNLKNTYGTVQLWTPDGQRDTGLQFLGTLVGDHAKTGIGTTLTTGCVLGAGASVFGGAMPPKVVPPFAWGDGASDTLFDLERFLTVAERVMRRRDVVLSARMRRQLAAAHGGRWDPGAGR